ncbi:MAG TPA: hypothetical protein PK299_06455 [Anaerolineales bacterium]|nr:hypothetical protein [Anaerolineales bacterium]
MRASATQWMVHDYLSHAQHIRQKQLRCYKHAPHTLARSHSHQPQYNARSGRYTALGCCTHRRIAVKGFGVHRVGQCFYEADRVGLGKPAQHRVVPAGVVGFIIPLSCFDYSMVVRHLRLTAG